MEDEESPCSTIEGPSPPKLMKDEESPYSTIGGPCNKVQLEVNSNVDMVCAF